MKHIKTRIEHLNDGAYLHLLRKGKLESRLRMGPNQVHAFITHPDGSVDDLGISQNLLTNVGRDLWDQAFGQAANVSGANSSAASATSLTTSGLTASQFVGWRVWVPVTGVTTAPVYGNIGANTTTVITVDQWWNAADAAGTTPAAVSAWMATPTCVPRFMGLTADTSGPLATDTALTSEIVGSGLTRAKATFAHTTGQNTYTMQVVFAVTGTVANIHKMGLFTANATPNIATCPGILVFCTNLNADASVANGDTLTVTDTIQTTG